MTREIKKDPALFKNMLKCIISLVVLILSLSIIAFSVITLFNYIDTNLNYFYENISPIIYVVMGIMTFIFFTTLCFKYKTEIKYESTHELLACIMGVLGVFLVLLTFLVMSVHSTYRERNYICKDRYSYSSIIPQSECTRITK